MMDPRTAGRLPDRPSLENLRKQAKALQDSGHHDTLSSAQLALARQYGFASWPKLKHAVELVTFRRLLQEGDAAGIRSLVESSPKLLQASFDDGSTALHVVAGSNRADLVELLVKLGGSAKTRFGTSSHSALSWAITVQAFDAARKLIELGEKPDLFCAAGLGLVDEVRGFWRDGQLRRHPSTTGSSRTTAAGEPLASPPESDVEQVSDALYFACRNGHLDVARWLVEHGGDANFRGYCGATCLAWAEMSGNADLCALLREHGGSDSLLDFTYEATPRVFGMMVVAGWAFYPARLYQRLAADPQLANLRGGRGTLLHAAAREGLAKNVTILLMFGADRTALDTNGHTPAEVALAAGHPDVAALMS